MPARTIAIGDIHGCHTALTALLQMVQPIAEDTLVILGDVVDRGPATKECIDTVIGLAEQCLTISLMGNHEEIMRAAIGGGEGMLEMWRAIGGLEALESYGGQVKDIPASHLKWLTLLRSFYETPTHIFVHATLEPTMTMANQHRDFLRWKKLGGNERPHVSGKRVICGHTPQSDGYPLAFPGWVCIDTGAYRMNWLTALDVDSDHVWQANEAGQTREFELAKYS